MLLCSGSLIGFSQDMEKVTIELGWYHQFQFAGIYAAKEMGFYEDVGLDVTIEEGSGIFNTNRILGEEVRYGIALSGQLLEDPKRDSILIVAIIFQHSHISLATRRQDSIFLLNDLVGKKVNAGPELKAMIRSTGVNLDAINLFGPNAYLNDLGDSLSQAVPFSILDRDIQNGIDLRNYKIFRPIEYGVAFYGDCLFTSQQELKRNPDRVEKMYQATLKGWKYAMENPDIMIDIIIEKYGWKNPRAVLENESQIVIRSLIIPSLYELGFSDRNKWVHMLKTLSTFGLLENDKMDLESFIYTSKEDENIKSLARMTRIAIGAAIALLIIGLLLIVYTRQLRITVRKRTKHIEEVNEFIIQKNEKLAEQKNDLEKLNYFKDHILAILSHDVRGPLNTFKGVIDLMNRHDIEKEELNFLISGTGAKLEEVNGFIDGLLFWAKNQLHGIKVTMEVHPLAELVVETIGILSLSAKVKNIHIENQIASDITILVDRTLFTTTLRNLISNAIKYCVSYDKIEIVAEKQHDYVKIYVKDNGPGMSIEQLNDCFNKDISSDRGSRNETGSGLGLFMCKEFVELNNGEIGVESIKNEGSTFWFTVKVAET